MKCDVNSLFSCDDRRVVFVDTPEDARIVENAVLDAYPQYKVEINDAFFIQKKVGIFRLKNKKTVWKILWNTEAVSDAVLNKGKAGGVSFLKENMELMDLNWLADRKPRALSYGQRLRASVLYDLLNGRKNFLLNDCYEVIQGEYVKNKGKDVYFSIERSVAHYEVFEWIGYNLIRITDMPVQQYFEEQGEDAVLASRCCYFTFENGAVVPQDGEELRKRYAHTAPSNTPVTSEKKPEKRDVEPPKPEYSEAHKAEKDKYVNIASSLANGGEYDEAWSCLCYIRDHLSSDYRQYEVDGLFAMCDFYLSKQEEEELRNTIEDAKKNIGEKNYRRAKEGLERHKRLNPGGENAEVNRLLDLCERVLSTPPDRPYMEIVDMDCVDGDCTMAIVARMVKGSVSVADTLVDYATGRSYKVESFRIVENTEDYNCNVNDRSAYLTVVDAESERRPFVFFVKDEFYEIDPEDWFFKG